VVNLNINIFLYFLATVTALLSLMALFAKNTLNAAFSLLGVLIGTAGIYALLNEHFMAAIQLVVYAGAIMVLFIFSIMLLRLTHEKHDIKFRSKAFALSCVAALTTFAVIGNSLCLYFKSGVVIAPATAALGNTRKISELLFSSYYIPFEVISITLIIGVVAAVVLAKRHIEVKES